MSNALVMIGGKDPVEKLGGHSTYVRAHARAAIRAGFEPHIFCASDRDGVFETDFGLLHRVASPFRPFRQIMIPGHAPIIAANLERFLLERSSGPQLIHGFGVWGYIGVALSRKLQRKGIKVIPITSSYTTYKHEALGKLKGVGSGYTFQNLNYRMQSYWVRLIVRRYEQQTYLHSRLVLINYESVRQILLGQYGSGVKFRKLPYTSESAFLPSKPGAAFVPEADRSFSEAPLIVSVSRHDARKGINILLSALAILHKSGVRFRACLVGGGPLLEKHRRLAAQLGLKHFTLVEGWVPNPARYLADADIFVLPSLEEGSGSLSLIEALKAGAAVVASGVDGIPEDVVDGDSALLVAPGDVYQLCEALRRVITDSSLRQRLRRRSRETYLEKFSPDVFTSALREIYSDLGFHGSMSV